MQSLCRIRFRPMPIEPSAMPAGIGFASATASTDNVMPTATQRTADGVTAFAQILDSSLVSADLAPGASAQAPNLASPRLSYTVTSFASPGVSRKSTKLHQAVDRSMPPRSNDLSFSDATSSAPTGYLALLPAVARVPANFAAAETFPPSLWGASGELANQQQMVDQQPQDVSASADVTAQAPVSSPTISVANAASNLFDRATKQTLGAQPHGTIASAGFASSMRSPGGQTTSDMGIAAEKAVRDDAEGFAPVVSAAATPIPHAEVALTVASSATVSYGLLARSASNEAPSTTVYVPIDANAEVAPESSGGPQLLVTPQENRDQAPSAVLAPAPVNRPASNAPSRLFVADQTIASAQPEQNFSSMAVPILHAFPRPLANTDLTSGGVAQEDSEGVPTSAEQATTASQAESAATAGFRITILSNDSPAAMPTAAPPFQSSESAVDSNSRAVNTAVSPRLSVPEANSDTQFTQTTVANPISLAPQASFFPTAATQPVVARSGSQTVPPMQAPAGSGTAQGEKAFATKIEPPKLENSMEPTKVERLHHEAVPVIPFDSDSNVPLAHVGQSTPFVSPWKTSVHSQEPHPQAAENDAKTAIPQETRSRTPQAPPAPHITSTTNSKLPGVIVPALPLGSTTVDIDLDDATSPHETEASNIVQPNSNSASSQQQSADSAPAFLPEFATGYAPAASGGASDAQAPTNTHSSRSQDSVADASSEPLASTLNPSDSSNLAQAVSAAVSAPRVDASTSAAAGTLATPASAPSDAATRTAGLARNPAETVELSRGLQAWNGGDNAQTRLVQSANLGGNLRSSEMNIALQSGALGPVELRTRVTGDVVGASIGVERHDAHAAIVGDLPALHQALHDRQLRVGDLSVYQGSLHSGGATGDGRPSQHRETTSQRPATAGWTSEQTATPPEIAAFSDSHDSGTLFDSNGRLSVQA
jgi:Flagellar hook-length control protein FliK